MPIKITTYTNDFADTWDEIVWHSNNGTLFHTRRFFSYHPPDRFKDHSLIFLKKEKPFSVFPAAEMNIPEGRWLISHPGASMGSFVVPENLTFLDSYYLVKTIIAYSKENQFNGIRINLPPTIYNQRLSNYIDFALIKHGFSYKKREVSSILFLEQSVEENLLKFRPSHRRAVKKAQREQVNVKQSEDFSSFYKILKKNLKIRHGVQPTHTLEELIKLKKLFPDRINLFGAYFNDQMIAGVVNFIATNNVVLAFYISHDEDYQEYRSVNLLFYNIFDWAIKSGYKVFDFGIFTENEKPNFGLARFKENFGASGMFRDTLEIEL
ncbi:MAG: GNAT family N-acetyltransferase [Candidatus Cloacimonetes bacterium]|nr:GNAT family N-acetyltransferase [Candidatus Cloacimonadota bacterium]